MRRKRKSKSSATREQPELAVAMQKSCIKTPVSKFKKYSKKEIFKSIKFIIIPSQNNYNITIKNGALIKLKKLQNRNQLDTYTKMNMLVKSKLIKASKNSRRYKKIVDRKNTKNSLYELKQIKYDYKIKSKY